MPHKLETSSLFLLEMFLQRKLRNLSHSTDHTPRLIIVHTKIIVDDDGIASAVIFKSTI